MRNIVLARVDDRLIHGQVVSGWIPKYRANALMIIDDELAKDRLLRRVLEASAPGTVSLEILTTETAALNLQKESQTEKERLLILTKTPLVFLRLYELGCPLEAVNLGGMGMYKERKPLFRNISCTDEEKEAINRLIQEGIEVFYQLVPEQKRYEARKFMQDPAS